MLIGGPNHSEYLIVGLSISHLGRWLRKAGHKHNKVGGGGYVLKEKIKCLKERLKLWNKD